MPKFFVNPHETLTRLIAANIVLDIIAVTIWTALPSTQWSIYQLGFSVAAPEAAVAAALFAITLFELRKNKKWAPILAIAITVTQRIFATYMFFPSPAIALTAVWSLIIVYFACKSPKTPKESCL